MYFNTLYSLMHWPTTILSWPYWGPDGLFLQALHHCRWQISYVGWQIYTVTTCQDRCMVYG